MKDRALLYILGESQLSPETCDDLITILSNVLLVEDIVSAAEYADITLITIPDILSSGSIWEGRSMGKGSSQVKGLPHMYNPLISADKTSADIGICDDILFFFPAELQYLKNRISTDRALYYASIELCQRLIQYFYSKNTACRAAYNNTMHLFEQLKAELISCDR